jgi:hypothetical protein
MTPTTEPDHGPASVALRTDPKRKSLQEKDLR